MGIIVEGKEHPVIQLVPFQHVLARVRKGFLYVSSVKACNIRSAEAALRYLRRERDGVSVVDALPRERI